MIDANVLVMGVSAAGKSTVGRALAERLDRRFVDADDHHPISNVQKMAAGVPLVDADRAPWLERLADLLATAAAEGRPVVLACSALADRHRAVLRDDTSVATVFLEITPREAVRRARARARATEHFAPSSLIDSQFDALEPPTDAIVVDAERPVPEVVAEIAARLCR